MAHRAHAGLERLQARTETPRPINERRVWSIIFVMKPRTETGFGTLIL